MAIEKKEKRLTFDKSQVRFFSPSLLGAILASHKKEESRGNHRCKVCTARGGRGKLWRGETSILLPGTVGTDYNGNVLFVGNNLEVGQQIRVHAWGRLVNGSTTMGGVAQIRVYFNAAALAETSGNLDLPQNSTWCWQFWA